MTEPSEAPQQPEFETYQVDEGRVEEIEQPETPKSEDTITFKRSHLYAVLLPLAFVTGLSLGYIFWGRSPAPATESAAAASSSAQPQASVADEPQQVTRYDVPIDDDPIRGPEDAPITIIEFSDYECPYCRKWHAEVYGRLFEDYPDQVRMVYRDFPLFSIHPNAMPAAEAANCAYEQGSFWEFHDKLFGMELALSAEAYRQYAQDLGLDVDAFNECVETRRYQDEVQADYAYASELGVRSTPTFFINGIALVGAQPYEVFQQVIDKELAGELD
jgi:protein-disulfide isomerase